MLSAPLCCSISSLGKPKFTRALGLCAVCPKSQKPLIFDCHRCRELAGKKRVIVVSRATLHTNYMYEHMEEKGGELICVLLKQLPTHSRHQHVLC